MMPGASQRPQLGLLLGLSMVRAASGYHGAARAASTRSLCMLSRRGKDNFRYSGKMRPGKQSPKRVVPASIAKPDYAWDGVPKAGAPLLPWKIEVKSAADVAGMRIAGRVAREGAEPAVGLGSLARADAAALTSRVLTSVRAVLDLAGALVAPGVTTDSIDALVHEEALKRGAYPSPLNYHGFPKSCCTSVNEVICHGIPDSYELCEGDIVNVDVTCYVGGYHGDCSETFLVGEVDDAGKQLVKVTHDVWQAAIDYCKPGALYKGIGAIIEDAIEPYGYSTVAHFCGHGIGKVFHTTPNIFHYRNNEPGRMEVRGVVRRCAAAADRRAATADRRARARARSSATRATQRVALPS
jgi:methionyl aminopeptidase